MRWHAGARDFAGCIAVLTPVAPADPPSAILMQRAKLFLKQPPAATWNAVISSKESRPPTELVLPLIPAKAGIQRTDSVPAFAATSG